MTEPTAPPPVVCTLTTKALAEQAVEWHDVGHLSLSSEMLANGVRSTFALSEADSLEDLAAREMDCCGTWLHIQTTRTDVFTMEITTDNPEGVDLIRSMAGLT